MKNTYFFPENNITTQYNSDEHQTPISGMTVSAIRTRLQSNIISACLNNFTNLLKLFQNNSHSSDKMFEMYFII